MNNIDVHKKSLELVNKRKEELKNRQPTAQELQALKKQERNQKLTDGIIVNNIWFNEDKLTQFTVMAQMIASIGQSSFEWGFEDGFAPITVQDAIATVMSASTQFQQIYKDYA